MCPAKRCVRYLSVSKGEKPIRTLYTNLKHKIPEHEQSGVVYKIDCKNCPKAYIGETMQKLSSRIKHHKYDVKSTKKANTSALADHSKELRHEFNFENAAILKHEGNKRQLQIQEVNQIILHGDKVCNYKTDAEHISPLYFNLVKAYGKAAERKRHRPMDSAATTPTP